MPETVSVTQLCLIGFPFSQFLFIFSSVIYFLCGLHDSTLDYNSNLIVCISPIIVLNQNQCLILCPDLFMPLM